MAFFEHDNVPRDEVSCFDLVLRSATNNGRLECDTRFELLDNVTGLLLLVPADTSIEHCRWRQMSPSEGMSGCQRGILRTENGDDDTWSAAGMSTVKDSGASRGTHQNQSSPSDLFRGDISQEPTLGTTSTDQQRE